MSGLRDRISGLSGVIDAGFASLATFAVGVTAAGILSPVELGAYALFFLAFTWLALIPTNLVLMPLELDLLRLRRSARLAWFTSSLRRGTAAAIPAGFLLGGIAPIVGVTEVGLGQIVALWVTGGLTLVFSSLQDHMRRLFHLAGHSGLAAITSGLQLGAISLAIWLLLEMDIPSAWVPLGALALANIFSLAGSILMSVRSRARDGRPSGSLEPSGGLGDILRSGGWFLLQGMLTPVGALLAATLVKWLAGLGAVGHAEAARLVAQPIFVLAIGLSATLGPRSMEEARAGDLFGARRLRRTFMWIFLPLAGGYVLYSSLNSPINLMSRLVPVAYLLVGLTALQGIGALTNGLGSPHRAELFGMRRERDLTSIEVGALVLRTLTTAATAALVGAYSIPIGIIASSLHRLWWRKRVADRSLAVAAKRSPAAKELVAGI